jgi:hypothetical protein
MKCSQITGNKTQCTRQVENKSSYCWQHQKKLETLPADVFNNIGKFCSYSDIIKSTTELKLDQNLYSGKKCITLINPKDDILKKNL